uniref:BTB domain-containing protein n=1 Tax=Glossina morsitans morsitans TaxID=37546 RepID=A0A1B0FQU3_GLOMM
MDVTLVCDEELLRAHKLVLAISSSYFQQIFISNSCKHTTFILKGITHNITIGLLGFMYRGVVNVMQCEIEAFLKIGQRLKIKGFSTNSTLSAASLFSEESFNQNAVLLGADIKANTILNTKYKCITNAASNNSEENAVENSNSEDNSNDDTVGSSRTVPLP